MSRTNVSISTSDGQCPAYIFKPEGAGPWPAVVMLMDAPAIRPTLLDMGERLAGHGYYVLLPDLFYRDGPYAPLDVSKMFADEKARNAIFAKIGKCSNPGAAKSDMAAFLAFLDEQPAVKGSKVGVTGFCMGGRLALIAAANFPDRIAAAGAFHPGNVANDQDPSSPHFMADRINAKVFVGGADHDNSFSPEDKARLEKALGEAGVQHRVEIFKDARHGYTMKDLSVYDEAAAERHWRETFALFDSTLKAA
jgi:carboxymethylenebutenolidase